MLELAGIRLTEELGRGSRGVVYRAEARGQTVAVKLPLEHTPDSWRRFRREGALLASVQHPSVARVLELGEGADGRPYLVTELVSGPTLASLIARGPQSTSQVLSWLRPLVGALETLHRKGLVHRDLKPSNILLSSHGAHLIDFGLVARAEGDDPAAGTLLYASPEQSGLLKRPVDARSDLYSLGVVLFESLSGRPPFTPTDPGELMRQHLVLVPPDLTRLDVPPAIAAITARLLRKDPDERYPSARSLEADLQRLDELEARAARGQELELASVNPPPREPLVGRKTHLVRLREQWQRVRQGKGAAALVLGQAGWGKSRLLQEFLQGLPAGTVFQGFCRAEGTPFAPLRGALERGLAAPSESRARAAVRAAGSHTPVLAGFSAKLDALLRSPAGSSDGPEELQVGLATWWIRMAEAEPLVLVLEDLHWLDPASLEVLLRLAQEIHRAPLLLVATTREMTEPLERVGRELTWSFLPLEQLERPELEELAAGVLGPGPVDQVLIDQLEQKTDRTPLGAREFLRAALDQAVVLPRWGGWECDRAALLSLELPSDILALMLRRFRQLEPEPARILAYAALLGLSFDPWALDQLFGTAARDALSAGRMAQLLDQCQFVHDRVREAAASSLPEAERRRACLELARVLEPVASTLEQWHRVARLFHEGQAGPEELSASHRTAGMLALRAHAYEAAYTLLSRVTDADGELLEALGEAAHVTRRRSEALEAYARALDLATDPLRRAHLRLQRCEVGLVSYDWSQILPDARAALGEARAYVPRGGPLGVVRALAGFGRFFWGDRFSPRLSQGTRRERHRILSRLYDLNSRGCLFAGDFPAMLENASLGALHALKLGPSAEKSSMYCFFTAMADAAGLPDLGMVFARKAEATARQAGHPVAVAQAQMFLGKVKLFQGKVREAEVILGDLLTRQENWLAPSDQFLCTQLLATAMVPRGRYQESLCWVERYEQRRRVANPDEPPSLPVVAIRAVAEAALGRPSEALVELSRLLPDASSNLRGLGNLARLLALVQRGDLAALRALLENEVQSQVGWQVRTASLGVAMGWKTLCLAAETPSATDLAHLETAVRQVKRHSPHPILLSHAFHCEAALERLRGRLDRAEKALERSERLADHVENDLAQLEVWLERARIARSRGQGSVAKRYAQAALDMARSHAWAPRLRQISREFSLLESSTAPHISGGSSGTDLQRLRLERQLAALLDLSLASARVLDPAVLAQNVLDHLLSLLGAERACLFRLRDGQLEEVAGRDHEGRLLDSLTGYSRSLVEMVARTGQPAVVSAGQDGPVDSSSSVQIHGLKSMLAAPLFLREEPVGVLYLDTRLARGLFTDEDAALLTALGSHIAISLETARAVEMELLYKAESQQRELAETVRDLATSLTETLEADQVWDRLLAVIQEHLRAQAAGLEPSVTLPGSLPVLPSDELLAKVLDTGSWQRDGSLLLVPLGSSVLGVWRDEPLDDAEVDLAVTFAGQASLALQKARLFAEVMRLATTDGLTGISNRRHFFQLAERELGLASRHNEPLSAILLDVDHFKKFNDTYGHDVGDDVLKVVANTLAQTIRREDLVARYGGEEFVLLLPRTAGKEALEVAAERLRVAIEQVRVRETLQVTISLGVAGLLAGETLHDLLLRADAALYESKRAGRNRATLAE